MTETYSNILGDLPKARARLTLTFRRKRVFFDQWYSACKVADMALRELLFIEEFKICLPECINVTYHNEQKVPNLQQVAILADKFTLMHSSSDVFSSHGSS